MGHLGLLRICRQRSCNVFTVCLGLGLLLFVIVWQQGQGFLKVSQTRDTRVAAQGSSNSSSIVPLSVLHSWTFVYGEQGCAKNHWRQSLFKLFQEWTSITSKNNIEYVLSCGTLLGALRTGDVIPYDSDMDVLVNIKYYKQLKKLSVERNFDPHDGKIRLVLQPQFELNVSTEARKRYTCSGKLTPTMVDVCSFQDPMGRLIQKYLHIDLYPFYEKGDNLLDTTDGDVRTYKKKDMFPLRHCKMMGFDSFCPQNPWNILQAYYRTKDFKPTYKCKGKAWVKKYGKHHG